MEQSSLRLWEEEADLSSSCWQEIAAMTFPATRTGAKCSWTGHGLSSRVPLSPATLPPALLGGLGGGPLSLLPEPDPPRGEEARSHCAWGCPQHTPRRPGQQMREKMVCGRAVLLSPWQCSGNQNGKAVRSLTLTFSASLCPFCKTKINLREVWKRSRVYPAQRVTSGQPNTCCFKLLFIPRKSWPLFSLLGFHFIPAEWNRQFGGGGSGLNAFWNFRMLIELKI